MTERPAPAPAPMGLGMAGLALVLPLSVVGAFIGIQQVATLGTAGHSGLLGALAAMVLGWLPWVGFRRFRSAQQQNLAQAAMLAATFGAGNALLLPIGLPVALGQMDLVGPLFLGAALALAADAILAFRLFGTRSFPAGAAWPQGMAAGETILAAREGGRRGAALVLGMLTGAFLAMYRVPMLAFGLAFIAPPALVAVFAAGLLVRGHLGDLPAGLVPLAGGDLMRAQVPQGMMLGAAFAALCQLGVQALRHRGAEARAARAMGLGAAAHLAIAVLLAVAGGLTARMEPAQLLLFVPYAALAALLHLVVSAQAAMHTGWFPGLAVAMIALSLGLALGFPPGALCLAVGFSAATGPGFIALGTAFRTGQMLAPGAAPSHAGEGRRYILAAAVIGFAVAGAMVWLVKDGLFAAQHVPPMDHVYAIAIRAGGVPGVLERMVPWAVAGALLQFAGGPARALGLLLATGLLLLNPAAGWALLAGLACRAAFLRASGGRQREELQAFAGGVIAGDALYGLYDSANRIFGVRR